MHYMYVFTIMTLKIKSANHHTMCHMCQCHTSLVISKNRTDFEKTDCPYCISRRRQFNMTFVLQFMRGKRFYVCSCRDNRNGSAIPNHPVFATHVLNIQ